MEIKGTIVDICMKNYEGFKQTIFIEPADLKSQLKPNKGWKYGDTLWVEVVVDGYLGSGRMRFKHDSTPLYNIPTDDIIAAFPAESEKAKDLTREFDAKVWAEEFNKVLVNKGIQPFDPGWFANAIMAGFDEANRRKEQEKEKVELPVKVDIDLYKDPAPALAEILIYDLADKFNKLLAVVKEMREKE